jgi:hypothetical protein
MALQWLSEAWNEQLDAVLALDRRTALAMRELREAQRDFERLALVMVAVEERHLANPSAATEAAWRRARENRPQNETAKGQQTPRGSSISCHPAE